MNQERVSGTIPLDEILAGKHPQYGTNRLNHRMIAAGVVANKCSLCGDDDVRLVKIVDHINGIHDDHR